MQLSTPIEAVTCFILRNDQVLLQERPASKIWGKLLNGPGGKIEPGESPGNAVIREVQEETGLTIATLEPRGKVHLKIPSPQSTLLNVEIFVASDFSGQETEKEGRLTWHHRDELPFKRMWADQKYWLPAALDGFQVYAQVSYVGDTLDISFLELQLQGPFEPEREGKEAGV